MARIMRCHRCDAERDINIPLVYPFPEDKTFITEPLDPLWSIDVSPRIAFVCHTCMRELHPLMDMWINEKDWDGFNPKTRSSQLPFMKEGNVVLQDYYVS
ncbi:MAG: hypothetical protein QM811_18330 [Pirellulales bacterium]